MHRLTYVFVLIRTHMLVKKITFNNNFNCMLSEIMKRHVEFIREIISPIQQFLVAAVS
jgi:uncharacterized protein YggT (Ycf19 family)